MGHARKINATIVTGFLGAGKTTFINQILTLYPEKQFALVENEFGEVSIDTKLIKGVDASQLFELKNGCICCTITNEYELVLKELAERFPHTEELLIETTGLASPAQVIKPFTQDQDILALYNFRGVVCVVDAVNFEFHLQQTINLRQIVSAGAIVVTKAEELSSREREDLSKRIKDINPLAPVKFAGHENSPFELADYWNTKLQSFHYIPEGGGHKNGFSARTIYFEQPVDRSRFEEWLSYLLDVYKNRIYRAKGIVRFKGEPFEYIVQAVGDGWEITEGDLVVGHQRGVLVFIGDLASVSFEPPADLMPS
jgi:G3E family GTPase